MATGAKAVSGLGDVGLLIATAVGLVGGALAWAVGDRRLADIVWAATTVVAIVPATLGVIGSLRRHRPGVDLIAVLALVGTLLVGEYLAGALIALMLATGRALESRASTRARAELRSLLERAPTEVHLYEGATIVSAPLDRVVPGDLLVVPPGQVVPVDGLVEQGPAIVDESALTGEPIPVERGAGEAVRSGTVNGGPAFDLRATTTAEEGTYAGIVRLVRQAEASSSPFVRLADRYALAFVPLTLAIAGLAWAVSGQATRAVAVLVVATPCPLILAAPIAIVCGLSRAAKRGVVVKGGAVLEALANGEVLLFDKTGTVTTGRPTVSGVVTTEGADGDEVLRLAGSLDQVSPHVLAASIVRAARERGMTLSLPVGMHEVAGQGAQGMVEGHRVAVGRAEWASGGAAAPWVRAVRRRSALDGSLTTFVAVDGRLSGALLLEDPVRTDARATLRRLRGAGIRRLVMVTGDRSEAAQLVGTALSVDEVLAERTPEEKVDAVVMERRHGVTIMVGDGINDAPALAAADVGIAVGARGATASSEAADVVLAVDRLDRVGEALVIARRSRAIARQSVLAGMGLSLVAMVIAAIGWLPATAGALLQECIDLATIANALRALTPGRARTRLEGDDVALSRRFLAEHRRLWPGIDRIRDVADTLGAGPAGPAGADLERMTSLRRFLEDEVLPHEEAEDEELYPVMARALGGDDPTATMSRGHVEIAHLIRRFGTIVDGLAPAGPDDDDIRELRTILYGLYAVLRLHFAQEDEGYFSLVDDEGGDVGVTVGPGRR